MAEAGGRHRRGRRAAARGVDGQGRHRDPRPGVGVCWTKIIAPRRTTPSRSAASWRSSARPARPPQTSSDSSPAPAEQEKPPRNRPSPAGPEEVEQPEPGPEPEPEPKPAAQSSGLDAGEDARTRRVRHRGHRHPLAEEGRRHRRDRRSLVEVSTDKVDTEIPSPVAGTLLSITAEEDVTVPSAGVGPPSATRARRRRPTRPEARAQAEAEPSRNPSPSPSRRPSPGAKPEPAPSRTPAAQPNRRGAEPSGDSPVRHPWCESWLPRTESTSAAQGTGVGGASASRMCWPRRRPRRPRRHRRRPRGPRSRPARGTGTAVAAPSALAHLRGTTQKANRIRQLTAKKTRESLQATAQLTQTHEVDMTKIVALRARAKNEFAEREGVNLTYPAVHRRAAIDAPQGASQHQRQLQRGHQGDHLLRRRAPRHRRRHRPGPALPGDPQRRRPSLGGWPGRSTTSRQRARSGDLKPDELSGGTFTITNIGSQGALFDTPILVRRRPRCGHRGHRQARG